MSAGDQVAPLLERARLRLALMAGGRRAAWTLLGAVLCLEAGLVLRQYAPLLGTGLLAAAAALLLGALGALLSARRPGAALVAEVLDARLRSGAALASAVEVLAGRHTRFGPLVLEAAGRALEGSRLSQLLPARLPPGLLPGCAVAVLLPFLLPTGGAAQVAAGGTGELPTLLAPGAAGGHDDSAPAEAGLSPAALTPAFADEQPGHQPWDGLPLDTIEALRARLSELVPALPPSDSGGGSLSAGQGPGDLREALESGDPSRVQAVLERLAAAAAKGDRAAAAQIEELAAGLGAPGAGGAPAAPDAGSDPSAPAPVAPVAGAELDLPPAFAAACRRYF